MLIRRPQTPYITREDFAEFEARILSSVTRSMENIASEMVNNVNRAIRNTQARITAPGVVRQPRRKSALPVRRPAELAKKHVSIKLADV